MNILPPAIRFKGDRDKAITLKAQALQFYNFVVSQANVGGDNFISRTDVLSDGSVISVTSKMESNYDNRSGVILIITPPDNNLLEGFELYMESGFYNLLSSATCAEATYRPATLHYNTPIQSYISSDSTPQQGLLDSSLDGEQLVDGFESISVGGKGLINQVFDMCGTSYSSTDKIYTLKPEDILKQKQTQNRIPSSLFSGKLRLYVQALYGSPRTDYRINIGLTGLPIQGDYRLYVEDTLGNDFELIWDYPYTSGIFTTSDYKYYLMRVGTSTIQIYPMNLSSSGNKLRAAVNSSGITDPVELSRLEGYMLSTGKVDTKNAFTIPISGAPSIGGETLGYGWKFSKSGHECAITIHSEEEITGLMTANEIRVGITETDGVFTASVKSQTTGNWKHSRYFTLWTPDFFVYAQQQVGKMDFGDYFTYTDCPIYGWYEAETYKSVTLAKNVYSRNETTSQESPTRQVSTGCGATDLSPYSWGTYNGANGNVSLSGLYAGSVAIVNASNESTKTFYWTSDTRDKSYLTSSQIDSEAGWFMCEEGTSVAGYLLGIGAWEPQGPYYGIKWTDFGTYATGKTVGTFHKQLRHNLATRNGVSNTGSFAIIIPLLDSESFTVVRKQTKTCNSSNQFEGGIDGNCLSPSSVDDCDLTNTYGVGITVTARGSSHVVAESPMFNFSSSGVVGTAPALSEGYAEMTLSNKTGLPYLLEEDGYIVKETSGNEASAAWADIYNHGTLYQPLANEIITRSSYNGATITYHGEGVDMKTINGYRFNPAVGWA